MKPRRPRTMEELIADKGFPYYIGKLVGAVEMTTWILSLNDDPAMQKLADKLADASSWFFEELSESSTK